MSVYARLEICWPAHEPNADITPYDLGEDNNVPATQPLIHRCPDYLSNPERYAVPPTPEPAPADDGDNNSEAPTEIAAPPSPRLPVRRREGPAPSPAAGAGASSQVAQPIAHTDSNGTAETEPGSPIASCLRPRKRGDPPHPPHIGGGAPLGPCSPSPTPSDSVSNRGRVEKWLKARQERARAAGMDVDDVTILSPWNEVKVVSSPIVCGADSDIEVDKLSSDGEGLVAKLRKIETKTPTTTWVRNVYENLLKHGPEYFKDPEDGDAALEVEPITALTVTIPGRRGQ